MIKTIYFVGLALLLSVSSFAAAPKCDSRAASAKLDFDLLRTIEEAQMAQEDLRTAFILGFVKTTSNIDTERKVFNLFRDRNTVVRSFFPMGNANLATFSSSLAGVLKAACSNSVISIQMSQKVFPETSSAVIRD